MPKGFTTSFTTILTNDDGLDLFPAIFAQYEVLPAGCFREEVENMFSEPRFYD